MRLTKSMKFYIKAIKLCNEIIDSSIDEIDECKFQRDNTSGLAKYYQSEIERLEKTIATQQSFRAAHSVRLADEIIKSGV